MTEDILRKVRALIAKAQSTEHEGEREVFMAKADQLMEKYAIDQAMLALKDDPTRAKLVVRHDMDISWWYEFKELDHDAKSMIASLWHSCVTFCRCYTSGYSTWNFSSRTATVYGMKTDVQYLDMLFTDLLIQMFGKLRPEYNPNQDMGENIARAKMAGMKYADIAVWLGKPEWVENGKPVDHGIMARAYKTYVAGTDDPWITMPPKSWQRGYVDGFVGAVQGRLRDMRGQREEAKSGGDNPFALALRDIKDVAQEMLFEDFPHLRPHDRGCTCKACTARRKPVRYRDVNINYQASSHGNKEGRNARIVGKGDQGLRSTRKLDK